MLKKSAISYPGGSSITRFHFFSNYLTLIIKISTFYQTMHTVICLPREKLRYSWIWILHDMLYNWWLQFRKWTYSKIFNIVWRFYICHIFHLKDLNWIHIKIFKLFHFKFIKSERGKRNYFHFYIINKFNFFFNKYLLNTF